MPALVQPRTIFSLALAWILAFGSNAGHGSAHVGQNSEAETYADRGLELAHAGDLTAAEVELKRAVQLAPHDPSFLASLGTVLAMEKKLEESTQIFQHALQLAPDDLTSRRYLAANLWQLHRYPEAKQNLEVILKQKPGDPPTLLLLGMVSENMHQYAAAAKALSAVPELVQQQPESIAALARSYYQIGETEKARIALRELLAHPAGNEGAVLGARIADEGHDYGTAEKLLVSLKPAFPDQAALGYEIARVQYHAGRFEKSQQTLLDLITSGPASGRIYNLLGLVYEVQRHPKEAVAALQEAIKIEPAVEQNYLDLGNILLSHRLLPAAVEIAKRATTLFPNSAQTLLLKGSVELKVGQFSDAVESYGRMLVLDPLSSDGRLGLAEAQFNAGMNEKAKAGFESGIKQFPKDARFRVQYAMMLLKDAETGNVSTEARAAQLLKSALALDSASSEAHYQLGELALKKGDPAGAAVHFDAAARLSPHDARVPFGLAQAYRRLGRKEAASKEMELYQMLKEDAPASPSAAGSSENATPRN
jgi:tetratricopeptide (TPR) repeat protein